MNIQGVPKNVLKLLESFKSFFGTPCINCKNTIININMAAVDTAHLLDCLNFSSGHDMTVDISMGS